LRLILAKVAYLPLRISNNDAPQYSFDCPSSQLIPRVVPQIVVITTISPKPFVDTPVTPIPEIAETIKITDKIFSQPVSVRSSVAVKATPLPPKPL
jgi:hypothetical protein